MKFIFLLILTIFFFTSGFSQRGTIRVELNKPEKQPETVFRDPIRFRCLSYPANQKIMDVSFYAGIGFLHNFNRDNRLNSSFNPEIGGVFNYKSLIVRLGAVGGYAKLDDVKSEYSLGYNVNVSHNRTVFLGRFKPFLEFNHQMGLKGICDSKNIGVGVACKIFRGLSTEIKGGYLDDNLSIESNRFVQVKLLWLPCNWAQGKLCTYPGSRSS